jgi:hypothetical protein
VFFGELGIDSCNLVKYFEDLGAKHINRGENPVSHQYSCLKFVVLFIGNSNNHRAGKLDVNCHYQDGQ